MKTMSKKLALTYFHILNQHLAASVQQSHGNVGRVKEIPPSPNRPYPLWRPPSLPFNWYRGSFQGVMRPGRAVDNWQLFSAEIKNECSCIPLLQYVPSWPAEGQLSLFWIPLTIMTRYKQHTSICIQSSCCIARK